MRILNRPTTVNRVIQAIATGALAAVAMASNAAAQPAAPGTAQGGITVNGKKTELTYAYAITRPSRSSNNKPETMLILADKPLATNAVSDDIERMKVQQRDGVKLIEIKLNDSKTVVGTNFEVPPLVVSAFSSEFQMTIDSLTDTTFRGRFRSASEHKMRDNIYSFDVSFNALMAAAPSAVSGKAAWDTMQGKVLAEYLRASRAGDKAAIRRVVTDVVKKELDGPKSAEFMKFLKADSADPKTARLSILSVSGGIAKVEVGVTSGSSSMTTRYQIHKVGDAWLVDEY